MQLLVIPLSLNMTSTVNNLCLIMNAIINITELCNIHKVTNSALHSSVVQEPLCLILPNLLVVPFNSLI